MILMKILINKLASFLTNRLVILLVIFVFLYAILFNRLFVLQIEQGAILNEKFILSIVKYRELEGQRGSVFDRNGFPLAENVIAYKVLLDGSIKVENTNLMINSLTEIIEDSGDEIIRSLPIIINEDGSFVYSQSEAQILRFKKNIFLRFVSDELTEEEILMSASDMFAYLRDDLFEIPVEDFSEEEIMKIINVRYPLWLNRYTQFQLETIAVNINDQTLARIEENLWKFPGVSITKDPLRIYNDAKYFSHIIGYTGKIDAIAFEELKEQGYKSDDIIGKIGIEQKMENYLRGTNGTQTVEVDNLGRTMQILETTEPTSGKDVYLTIDRDLQIECYNILENKLAFLLQSTLSFNGSAKTDQDDGVTLMKDVFSSIFNSGLIDIELLEASTDDQSQNDVYNTFLKTYEKTFKEIEFSMNNNSVFPKEDDLQYYSYILKKLNEEGYLTNGYKSLDTYAQKYEEFLDRTLGFKELLEIYANTNMFSFPKEADESLTVFDTVESYILKNIVSYNSFKKIIYVRMAKEEKFSYSKLCLTLIEQGKVGATEDQVKNLKNGREDVIGFMQEKITKLEITPQQLALDPSSGSIVVTDVNTGEVLALVSYPSYDNNLLVNNFDYDYYTELLNDPTTPLYPRATQGKMAPGSTFKMITAIAGIEEGVMGKNEVFSCQGIFTKISPAAKCWIYSQGGTHGALTIPHALEVSCNYFYYEVGYRLAKQADGSFNDSAGIAKLQKYAEYLGLGAKTGIEIDDSESTLPTKDAVRASIGQTDNSYTPVQLARYVSTIANGGDCYELNVIDKIMTTDGEIYLDKTPLKSEAHVFGEDTFDVVQEGMHLVTMGSRGTVRSVFNDFPIDMAGKTGTAQQSMTRPDHALFVGYAPFESPEVSVVIAIPFGYGSFFAANTAEEVVGAYYEIKEVTHGKTDSIDFILE